MRGNKEGIYQNERKIMEYSSGFFLENLSAGLKVTIPPYCNLVFHCTCELRRQWLWYSLQTSKAFVRLHVLYLDFSTEPRFWSSFSLCFTDFRAPVFLIDPFPAAVLVFSLNEAYSAEDDACGPGTRSGRPARSRLLSACRICRSCGELSFRRRCRLPAAFPTL